MSTYTSTLGGRTHRFDGLARLLAAASPERSGDRLAGLAAESAQARVAARWALADVPLARFLAEPVIPYEDDDVTRLIVDTHDAVAFAPVAGLTVGEFREWLLSDAADASALTALAPGLTPEMTAAVSKLMGNADLVAVARKVRSSRPSARRSACPAGSRPASSPTTPPTTRRASPRRSSTDSSSAPATRSSASTRRRTAPRPYGTCWNSWTA